MEKSTKQRAGSLKRLIKLINFQQDQQRKKEAVLGMKWDEKDKGQM